MNRSPSTQIAMEDLDQTERWKNFHTDLLEPQFYPDPMQFRKSLQKLTRDDIELMKNLASHKSTIRVLAPYLRIMQRKLIASFAKGPRLHPGPRLNHDRKASKGFHERKLSLDHFARVIPNMSDKAELMISINETADILKTLVSAKNVVAYIVNPIKNEIFQSPSNLESSTSNLTWKIEKGTTMAAFCAFTKEYAISSNIGTDMRFPLGLGYPGTLSKFAICVPVKTPDHQVVALYELSRDAFDSAFEKRDVQLILAVTTWMGVAILQNNLYIVMAKKDELTNYLTQLTDLHHSGNKTSNKTLTDIVVFARETIRAERCSLHIVHRRKLNSLVLEEFEQGADNLRSLYRRRTKKEVGNVDSMLGKVILKNEVVNNRGGTVDGLGEGEEVSDVRSILCVPVISSNEAIGAITLTNKKTAAEFDKNDEETLKIFASYCAININHSASHEKLNKCELNRNVLREMVFHHIKPCVHDEERINKSPLELPENFFSFTWYPSPDDMPRLVELTISMFSEVLGDSFMALNNVPRFILTVKNCYRPNPYHNFLHAFGVTHAMANIISRYSRIFTGVERKGLMIAALCHDVDHRGYNNNFLQLTQHHLCKLYDTSPLENHHFAVTKMLLNQCKMFRYFKPEIYNELVTEIYDAVIATDLALYFQNRMELMNIADAKTFTFKNPAHRRLVKGLMMTACDLSGQTKPMHICQKITEDVYEEFYQQGDIEKKMGFNPLPTMDRDKRNLLAENQVQFLSVVVLPCIETVCRIFGTLSPIAWDTKILLNQWKELVEVQELDTWRPEDSLTLSLSSKSTRSS